MGSIQAADKMNKIVDIPQDYDQPLFDIRKFIAILWGRKLLIIAAAAISTAIAIGYITVTAPSYFANAVVLVDPRETRTTTVADSALAGIGSDSAAIASQVAVIRSRALLNDVFESEAIAADPEFTRPGLVSRLSAALTGSSAAMTEAMVFEKFAGAIGVEREGLTYVINVGFRSGDPDKAARIANAIVERYVASQVAEKSTANADVADRLTGRIGAMQAAVREAERLVEDFKVAHNIFDAGNGMTLLQANLDQLNTQLLAAQEAARQAESRRQQAEAAGTSPSGLQRLTEILSSSAADRLREDYNQKAAALASSESTLGPRHPTLVGQRAELRRVEGLIVGEAERITSELRAAAELARQNVERTEAQIAATRMQADEANRRAVELRELERNADAQRAVLDQFQKRSEETGQLESLQVSDVRIIGRAVPPVQAVWPKPVLLLPLGLVLGLALGTGLALLLGPVPAKPARSVRAKSTASPAPVRQKRPPFRWPALPSFSLPARKPAGAKPQAPVAAQPSRAATPPPLARPPVARDPSVQAARPPARLPQAAHHPASDRARVRAAADEIRSASRYARLD